MKEAEQHPDISISPPPPFFQTSPPKSDPNSTTATQLVKPTWLLPYAYARFAKRGLWHRRWRSQPTKVSAARQAAGRCRWQTGRIEPLRTQPPPALNSNLYLPASYTHSRVCARKHRLQSLMRVCSLECTGGLIQVDCHTRF